MDWATRFRGFVCLALRRFYSAALLCAAIAAPAAAAPLSLSTGQSSVLLSAGDSRVITGQITNVTGVSLQSSELLLSITGYPFDVLEVTPLLGDPDLLLADRTISAVLDLFEITALPGVIGTQSFDLSILLEDINGNFADPVVLNVTVQGGGVQVPEPDTLALALLALLPLAARRGAARAEPVAAPRLA